MFAAEDREVFVTKIGGQDRRFDPMAVDLALTKAGRTAYGEWYTSVRTYERARASGLLDNEPAATQDAMFLKCLEACQRIAALARAAFGVPEFDAGGPPDSDCMRVMNEYLVWQAKARDDALPLAGSPGAGGLPASSSTTASTAA